MTPSVQERPRIKIEDNLSSASKRPIEDGRPGPRSPVKCLSRNSLWIFFLGTLIVFWSTIENVIEIYDHCDDDGNIRINDGKIIAGCVCTCGRG